MTGERGILLDPHFFEQKNGRDNKETGKSEAAEIIYKSHECRLADELLIDQPVRQRRHRASRSVG